MDVNGYEIDMANCSFKQTQQLLLKFDGPKEHDELFPVSYYMDNQTGEYSLIENEIRKRKCWRLRQKSLIFQKEPNVLLIH